MRGYCHTHNRPFDFVCPECPPLERVAKAAENQWSRNQVSPDEYPHLSPLPEDSRGKECLQATERRLPGFFPDGNIHHSAIVSLNCRWRYPDLVKVGAHSVVDDFGYFSTQLEVGRGCHIGAGVNISGGPKHKVVIADHSSVTYHSDIVCGSPDYVRQIVTIEGYGEDQEGGDVVFERFTGAAAQTLIFWSNHIPEGTVILARGIVRPNFPFEPWTVYGMDPYKPWDLKKVMPRDRDAVLRQAEKAERWMEERERRGQSDTQRPIALP